MTTSESIELLTRATEAILAPPFEWCHIEGGAVVLEDGTQTGGTSGGEYQVADFAMAKYPITNAQYKRFLDHSDGFADPRWWEYSAEAIQWRKDRPNPMPMAFDGADVPCTRVSWFDSMAFCAWLSTRLKEREGVLHSNVLTIQNVETWNVRLPTEQQWQRAAYGDTGWSYPWGNEIDETRANYANHVGRPTPVVSYPSGQSPYGVMDMIGNLWEMCLTVWGDDSIDVSGYTYRVARGGAWNVRDPIYLRATDRGGHPPRSRLNDAGFRCVYCY